MGRYLKQNGNAWSQGNFARTKNNFLFDLQKAFGRSCWHLNVFLFHLNAQPHGRRVLTAQQCIRARRSGCLQIHCRPHATWPTTWSFLTLSTWSAYGGGSIREWLPTSSMWNIDRPGCCKVFGPICTYMQCKPRVYYIGCYILIIHPLAVLLGRNLSRIQFCPVQPTLFGHYSSRNRFKRFIYCAMGYCC